MTRIECEKEIYRTAGGGKPYRSQQMVSRAHVPHICAACHTLPANCATGRYRDGLPATRGAGKVFSAPNFSHTHSGSDDVVFNTRMLFVQRFVQCTRYASWRVHCMSCLSKIWVAVYWSSATNQFIYRAIDSSAQESSR